MASLGSYLPEGGRAVWRRDRQPEYAQESQAVRHIVIRGTEVVPHPSPHVVYRIDVLTEHSHWYVCRRYSEFHDLHRKLMRHHKISRDLLPPKKLSGNFTPQLINARRKQLEDYLQKLINSEPQVSQSQDLLIFLDLPAHDIVHVTELLARQLYSLGDKLLEQATPIALTINDLYCITKRLRLPMDLQHNTDVAGDLGHLYSFIHQVHSLKVIQPPPPSSVTRMAFEVSPFRSLTILKIDSVPLTQVSGLVRIQQQLEKITAQHCLKSLRELLIDSVEERRQQGAETQPFTDSWRLVATAKFTSNRVVIQPWHKLTYLNISQNKLTYLDDSLQVLPALKELNISHNLLVSIDLQHLCLPTLTSVNLSYNNISLIISRQLVLEGLKHLNIGHNSLTDLAPLVVFIGLKTLNISYNKIASRDDFVYLSQLKTLATLTIKGNPIMTNSAARLVLLARFMHKSRMVSVDGLEATSREQAKIRSLTEKYGPNTDQWPMTRRVQPTSSPSHQLLPQSPPPLPQSPPTVHVSWSVESIKRVPTSTISETSPCHSLSTTTDESYCSSIDHPLFYDTTLSIKNSPLPLSRDDPDGRSDVSTHSSDAVVLASPSPLVLPTPPCTPLSPGEGIRQSSQSSVTPQMISAALEALTQAANHASTPTDEAQLPELLSQALHNFISEQTCATPPSTPLNQDEVTEEQPISSTELISALTTALSIHCETNRGPDSGSGSTIPSVPVGTPQEGLSELAKLGIQPESILHALNSLSCQSKEEMTVETSDEEDELLATITNHNISKSLTTLEDNNEKGSPHLVSSDERSSSRPVYSDPTPRKYSRVIDIAVPLI